MASNTNTAKGLGILSSFNNIDDNNTINNENVLGAQISHEIAAWEEASLKSSHTNPTSTLAHTIDNKDTSMSVSKNESKARNNNNISDTELPNPPISTLSKEKINLKDISEDTATKAPFTDGETDTDNGKQSILPLTRPRTPPSLRTNPNSSINGHNYTVKSNSLPRPSRSATSSPMKHKNGGSPSTTPNITSTTTTHVNNVNFTMNSSNSNLGEDSDAATTTSLATPALPYGQEEDEEGAHFLLARLQDTQSHLQESAYNKRFFTSETSIHSASCSDVESNPDRDETHTHHHRKDTNENNRVTDHNTDGLDENQLHSKSKSKNTTTGFESFTAQLKASFLSIKQSFNATNTDSDIDWDFWAKVISDYEIVAKKHPRMMNRKLQQGIPEPIRGMVWQLLCRSKSTELEKIYRTLLHRTSTHEKLITRDLTRTFPKHEYFQQQINQDSLFNIAKAYSLYDPEVGYCQGIPFIVGPLLMNMPEESAFCVLVRLMRNYNFRDMYTPQMKGLQLRLFQYDQLLKDMLPALNLHLDKEGIRSSMYASQWFMTLFAYRFPLSIVFRILDIVIGEGFESVFKFAFALLKKNQETIMSFEFESLLEFLKNGLFDVYEESSSVDQFMIDAAAIRIAKSRLDKLHLDWEMQQRRLDPELLDIEALKTHNLSLTEQLKRMDKAYEQLNLEHIQLANELLEKQMLHEKEIEKLEELEQQVDSLRAVITADRNSAEEEVKEEMEQLAQKNLDLTRKNAELEDHVSELENMLIQVRMQYAQSETDRESLQLELEDLKRRIY